MVTKGQTKGTDIFLHIIWRRMKTPTDVSEHFDRTRALLQVLVFSITILCEKRFQTDTAFKPPLPFRDHPIEIVRAVSKGIVFVEKHKP